MPYNIEEKKTDDEAQGCTALVPEASSKPSCSISSANPLEGVGRTWREIDSSSTESDDENIFEDITDEAYIKRHRKYELKEKREYKQWQTKMHKRKDYKKILRKRDQGKKLHEGMVLRSGRKLK